MTQMRQTSSLQYWRLRLLTMELAISRSRRSKQWTSCLWSVSLLEGAATASANSPHLRLWVCLSTLNLDISTCMEHNISLSETLASPPSIELRVSLTRQAVRVDRNLQAR